MSTAAQRSSSIAGSEKPASLHDSARGSPSPEPQHQTLDPFRHLVNDINRILGPSNGIDSESVDVEDLVQVMKEYDSVESQWAQYAFSDAAQAYTRNLVDRGNGKANLLILVWTPGKRSPVHDHANAHCIMKVLKGSLEETLYGFPCQASTLPSSSIPSSTPSPSTRHHCCRKCNGPTDAASELPVKRRTVYGKDAVTYMSDRLGLHSVGNPSQDPNDYAVSLHLYTPPNAAHTGCHTYDIATGKKSSQRYKMNHFYSELGVQMED